MITIHVTGRDGALRSHRLRPGTALMFALRDQAGEPVEGLCGGCATCGTCHVHLDRDWAARLGPPEDHEAAMLEMLEHCRDGESRLACQIEVTAALDGLTLTLAPEE